MTMPPQEAAKVLRDHQKWRMGGDGPQTDVTLLTQAIDAAVAALEATELFSADITSAGGFRLTKESSDYIMQWQVMNGTIMTVTSLRISQTGLERTAAVLTEISQHIRQSVEKQDAARGNFRRAMQSGQDGIDGVHATDIIPASAIVGDDDGAVIVPATNNNDHETDGA